MKLKTSGLRELSSAKRIESAARNSTRCGQPASPRGFMKVGVKVFVSTEAAANRGREREHAAAAAKAEMLRVL